MRSRDLPGVLITGLVLLAFAGCESAPSNAPPVTAALIRTGTRENADARMLSRGRSLLLHRCIQCHAPPDAAKLSPERLRNVLATMASRAHLSPEEHEAVLKYLLAVRSL